MTKFVCCAAASGLPMRSAGAGWQGVRGVWRARGPGPRQEHPADKGFGRARHARACQASPHRLAKLRFRVLGSPQGAAKRRPARGARQVRQARRAAEEAAAAAQARTAAAAEQQRRLERLEAEAADAHAAALRCAPAPGPAQASRAGPRRGRHACCHADAPALLEAMASRVDSAHAPALWHAAPRSRGCELGRRHACVKYRSAAVGRVGYAAAGLHRPLLFSSAEPRARRHAHVPRESAGTAAAHAPARGRACP